MICNGCNGVVERDCFNPPECEAISRDMEARALAESYTAVSSFQSRVAPWMAACFGPRVSADTSERNHRFIEEALELVQSGGMPREDAHALVDYVYNRPVGDPPQEVGGVMVTLAALCLAAGMDMHQAAEIELDRIWGKIEQIRAKQASKPRNSPLPEYSECPTSAAQAERSTS